MTSPDLAAATYAWSMQWWDQDEHMVWNPPGSLAPRIEARELHLVPNTAWLAYALLAAGDDSAGAEAVAAIGTLVGLQYDRPDAVIHGTYRRFLESPEPPSAPVMWEDYDPNWRQFVGTTFAVILEDFGASLDPDLVSAVEASIGLACVGERDGRIPPSYSNPALMRAWLDAWYGRRSGAAHLVDRGRAFAEAIVADFDRFGAFDEFNSPTYYGIDLYALRLWRTFPPDPYFAAQGERLENAVWRTAGDFYNANLRNFCGPFTRSYHPDATRSVTMFSLWVWALIGPERAPVPPLDAPVVDHGHDLMAGPIFARLAGEPTAYDLADFRTFGTTRVVAQELARGRRVSAWISPELMIGAEASGVDWGGWPQFMPATAHWRTPKGDAVLWMVDAHEVHAAASDRQLIINAPGASAFRFRLQTTDAPVVDGVAVTASGMRVAFTGEIASVSLTQISVDTYEIRALPSNAEASGISAVVRFHDAAMTNDLGFSVS